MVGGGRSERSRVGRSRPEIEQRLESGGCWSTVSVQAEESKSKMEAIDLAEDREDMAKVTVHFVRGNNPEKFACTLTNFMGKCYPGEDDLAIARAVLMYLSQGNLRDANKLMGELRKQLKAKQQTLPQSDLIQFVVYLLETLERDALPLFRMLRQKYKSSIDRERLFDELLDDIAEKFYGVRRQVAFPGMFGDIFKMMDMQL